MSQEVRCKEGPSVPHLKQTKSFQISKTRKEISWFPFKNSEKTSLATFENRETIESPSFTLQLAEVKTEW
jgi:hypothetical protein